VLHQDHRSRRVGSCLCCHLSPIPRRRSSLLASLDNV
jgi:hypothetical protein